MNNIFFIFVVVVVVVVVVFKMNKANWLVNSLHVLCCTVTLLLNFASQKSRG